MLRSERADPTLSLVFYINSICVLGSVSNISLFWPAHKVWLRVPKKASLND
jgi:hypothetical protein